MEFNNLGKRKQENESESEVSKKLQPKGLNADTSVSSVGAPAKAGSSDGEASISSVEASANASKSEDKSAGGEGVSKEDGDDSEEKKVKKPLKIGPEPVEKGKVYAHTQNVVVSASIERPLPLVRLATQLEGAEYNPEQFPGLILKIEEPKASALLFSSGKVICTGTKSIKEARKAIKAIVKMIAALGLKVSGTPDVEVTNIVASGSVGGRLNLNSIIFNFDNTEYEPEQFPGLVYKMPDTNVTFLLFGTGRVVITGAKSQREIKKTIHRLRDQLVEGGELEE